MELSTVTNDFDMDTTLVRRGNHAATFSEMAEYARLVETRPLTKLLEELPALASLSQSKFDLTALMLRKRFRKESKVDRLQLEAFANEIAGSVDDIDVADRIRNVFSS